MFPSLIKVILPAILITSPIQFNILLDLEEIISVVSTKRIPYRTLQNSFALSPFFFFFSFSFSLSRYIQNSYNEPAINHNKSQ